MLSYVVNWDELVELLKNLTIGDINIDINTEGLEKIFEKYFPDIIELLKAIVEQTKGIEGTQQIKGMMERVFVKDTSKNIVFIPETDVLLTGITYSQNNFSCDDKWDLYIEKDENKIYIFKDIYAKDFAQHKFFNVFYPVPLGYNVIIEHKNDSSSNKIVWCDFEYINLVKLESNKDGTIIVKYLYKDELGNVVQLAQDTMTNLEYDLHTIENTRDFEGYTKKEPTKYLIMVSSLEPTRIVEFWYTKDELINHDYDLKVTLRWENNSTADLDLHCYINKNKQKHIYFGNKKYEESTQDIVWLDFDYTSHGLNGFIDKPEVITILGFKASTLNIQIINCNNVNLRDDCIVTIENRECRLLKQYTIPKNMGGLRAYYICDIKPATNTIIDVMKPIQDVGDF